MLRWFARFVEGFRGWGFMQRAYIWKRGVEMVELVWFVEEGGGMVINSGDVDVRRKELDGEVV